MNTGLTLTHDMMLVLGLVAFTVLMLVLEWIRADLVALLIIVVIGITRLMPVEQLFDGFAGNAVISLLGVMIMGAGLDRTGVLNKAASFILRLSGGIESRLETAVEHHPTSTEDAPQKVLVPESDLEQALHAIEAMTDPDEMAAD